MISTRKATHRPPGCSRRVSRICAALSTTLNGVTSTRRSRYLRLLHDRATFRDLVSKRSSAMACGLRLKYALVGTAVGVSCLGAQSTPAKATAPSLPGLSYAAGDWNTKMPVDRRLVLLCYRLVPTNSAAQPYTLEPTDFRETDNDAEIKASWTKNKRSPCSVIDYKHPLLERRILAVAIDVRKWQGAEPNVTRLAVLNINVTTQPGKPLNPTPVRPSVATASITELNYGNSVYYLRWPIALVGDAIPTISINVVYIAPAPGESWHSNTVYAPGAVVSPGKRDGHFYGLLNEGRA